MAVKRGIGLCRFLRQPIFVHLRPALTKVIDTNFVKVLSWYDNE